MLFGELVVSDGLTAWLSYRFPTRYKNSIALQWQVYKRNRNWSIVSIIVGVALISSAMIMQIPKSLCLTSNVSNEKEWALTQCPERVNRTISDWIRVDDMYYTDWGLGLEWGT